MQFARWSELYEIASEECAHNALEELKVADLMLMKNERELREWLRENRSEYDVQSMVDYDAERRWEEQRGGADL